MIDINNITVLGIFLEGLLSFFSPCVLPLIPLYMAYLSSGAKIELANGETKYQTGKVFASTLMFVLGISCTFFILGLSIDIFKDFFNDYQNIIGIIGGTIVLIFGLGQIGLFTISFKEFHLPLNISMNNFGLLKAFMMGFVFSFAWTPCVGPMLANVILLAMSDSLGNAYLFIYVLGLIVPFLVLGLFTSKALNLLSKYREAFKWVLKISGLIMLCFGLWMIGTNAKTINQKITSGQNKYNSSDAVSFYDMTFYDQEGKAHKLSEHEGEYIFLNFVATWCTYCKAEIPEFDQYAISNSVNAYYVMSPLVNQGSIDDIKDFYKQYNMRNDLLIDEDAYIFSYLGVSSYPTLVIIGPDGSFIGYATGAMNTEQLKDIYEQAIERYEAR